MRPPPSPTYHKRPLTLYQLAQFVDLPHAFGLIGEKGHWGVTGTGDIFRLVLACVWRTFRYRLYFRHDGEHTGEVCKQIEAEVGGLLLLLL